MKLDFDIQRSIIYFMKGAMEATQLAFVKECFNDGGELELVDVLMEIAEPVALTIHNHYWPNYRDDWSGVVDYEVTEELGEKYIENWSVILENNQQDSPSLEHVSHLLHSAMREFLHPDIPWHPLITSHVKPTEPEERLPPASSGTPMPECKPAKIDIHREMSLQYFMKGATGVMGFDEFVDSLGIGDYEFMEQLYQEAKKCQYLIHEKYLSKYPFLALTDLAYNVAEPLGRSFIYALRHRRNDLPITQLPDEWVSEKCKELVQERVDIYCDNEGLNPVDLEVAYNLEKMLNSEVPGPVKNVLIHNQRALRELFAWEDS